MSRDEMIALLVCDTVERIQSLKQVFWLQGVLENGFAGFRTWSDDELVKEMRQRGLDRELLLPYEQHSVDALWDADCEFMTSLTHGFGRERDFGEHFAN